MKRFLAVVTAVACGCGSSSPSSQVDDPDGGTVEGDGSGSSDNGDAENPPQARAVHLTLTNRPNNATMYSFLVAYQDGSAAWKLAPAPTGDTYSFDVFAPVYGVAFACIGNGNGSQTRSVTSAFFAVSDRTDVTLEVPARCSDRNAAFATLSGHVANRPGNGILTAQFGARNAFVGSISGNFQMQVGTATRDLLVTRTSQQGFGDFTVEDVLVDRNVAVSGNTSVDVDFADAQSTDSYNVNVSAAPNNARVTATTTLYTANGTSLQLQRKTSSWETGSLPQTLRLPTDVYDQSIQVATDGGSVTVSHATHDPGDQTLPSIVAPAPVMTTVATDQPYLTLQSAWDTYPDAIGYVWTAAQQTFCSGSGGCSTLWTAYLSPSVLGASPGFRMPDLSGLTGWKDSFQLATNVSIAGSVTAVVSSAGNGDFPTSAIPPAGTDRVLARRDYGLSP